MIEIVLYGDDTPKFEGSITNILQTATDYSSGRYGTSDVLRAVGMGTTGLLLAIEDGKLLGVTTVTIEEYPGRRMLNITFCAGERLDEWREPKLERIERLALERGCSGIEVTGRKGWVRKLAGDGYEEKYVVLEKDLSDALDEASRSAA